jgi:CHAT domain-containing protein/Tfp pilus assembly protein PilF
MIQNQEKVVLGELKTLYFYYSLENKQGNFKSALPIALEIRDVAKKLGEIHPLYASSLNELGNLYLRMGYYAAAEPLYMEALNIQREITGECHRDYADFLNNLANLYREIWDYSAAESLHKKVLEIRRTVLGDHHPEYAASLNNLGSLYRDMGNYTEAESFLKEALEIKRTTLGEDHLDYAASLNNLGVVYIDVENYVDAESLIKWALMIKRSVLGKNHPDYANSLNNLGLLYFHMGKYADAEALYKEVLKIRQVTLDVNHPDYADALNNLAILYTDSGNYSAAERFHKEVLEIRRTILGEQHPDYADSLNNLGCLYCNIGKYSAAESFFRGALAIRRTALGGHHPDYANSLNNLAVLYTMTQCFSDALSYMQEAVKIEDWLIGQVFSIGTEQQRETNLATFNGSKNRYLSLITMFFSENSQVIQSAFDLVLRRKAIGAEALMVQRDVVLSGKYPHLAEPFHDLKMIRIQIAKKVFDGAGGEGLEEHERLLFEWSKQKDRIESELARSIPEMSLEKQLRDADRTAILENLPPRSILVEFIRFEKINFHEVPTKSKSASSESRYLAFLLSAQELENVSMIELGDADKIDTLIGQYHQQIEKEWEEKFRGAEDTDISRKATQKRSETTKRQNLGIQLRQCLFDPIKTTLGEITRLFISPDGLINLLPFETLPLDEKKYLIDKYHISYVSSGRDIVRFNQKFPGEPGNPMIIADPDFDLCSLPNLSDPNRESKYHRVSWDLKKQNIVFQRLKETEEEGKQIVDLLKANSLNGGDPVLFIWRNALKKRIKEAANSPKIIHFATHGFFLMDQMDDQNRKRLESLQGKGWLPYRENPLLRSMVVLAGANTFLQGKSSLLPPEAEDGLLTAEDVSCLNLTKTKLVVLSACETGRGIIRTGEGVFGLRRAFVIAGAETLIMSLWEVPDSSTRELMVNYYMRLLKGGEGRSEALRKAQLILRKKHSDVMSWGAFICQGYPGPL